MLLRKKIEMYLAAEIMIIYQDFFPRKTLLFYNILNHFIVLAPFTSGDEMHHDYPNSNTR